MEIDSKVIKKACNDLLLNDSQMKLIILRSPNTYKKYTIPKKSGGFRLIAQPAKETKYVQRWLIENFLGGLPVSEFASAYREGASIKNNASLHRKNRYLVKMDFKDFFPSIRSHDLERHFLRYGQALSREDIKNIVRLCCIRSVPDGDLCLSVGAPVSPFLSNTIMYDFDNIVSGWCLEKKISYSRYADDLAFSTNEKGISLEIEKFVKFALELIPYPALRINEEKTIHLSKKNQRRITGVIINNDDELSLGRSKKRDIRSMVHHYVTGSLDPKFLPKLQGLLGFAKDIEPRFLEVLNKKYGRDNISRLLKEGRQ